MKPRPPSNPFDELDPSSKAGTRHHTVPRFYLQRWCDDSDRLQVYSRVASAFRTQRVQDLAIRDFYTIVTKDNTLDARMEDVLGHVEGAAAEILRGLLSSVRPLEQLSPEQGTYLAMFLCLQIARALGVAGSRNS
jgi:hypothetical protein